MTVKTADPLRASTVADRAAFAGKLTEAATTLAAAARAVRDADAEEMLRLGERPATVARTIGIVSAQIARMKPASKAPTSAEVAARADAVKAAIAALDALLESA